MVMPQARFSIHCASAQEANVVLTSLSPELQQGIPKTQIKLDHKKEILFLSIAAKDTSSLRAACNSYLRWIHTALEVIKTS